MGKAGSRKNANFGDLGSATSSDIEAQWARRSGARVLARLNIALNGNPADRVE